MQLHLTVSLKRQDRNLKTVSASIALFFSIPMAKGPKSGKKPSFRHFTNAPGPPLALAVIDDQK